MLRQHQTRIFKKNLITEYKNTLFVSNFTKTITTNEDFIDVKCIVKIGHLSTLSKQPIFD